MHRCSSRREEGHGRARRRQVQVQVLACAVPPLDLPMPMHPPERLETERLILRRAHLDDAPALFQAYANDPQATRYLSWRTHESVNQTAEFLEGVDASWDSGQEHVWVLVPADEAEPIGAVGATTDMHGVEIGYVLGRDFWGRGLMVEAVRAVLSWFAEQPSVYRVWAYCAVNHERSAQVLLRSGMTYEGTLRRWVLLPNIADEPCDARVFSWIRTGTC